MSMYMNFFIRHNDVFLPINVFNRSTDIYQYFNCYIPYEKLRPVTQNMLNDVVMTISDEKQHQKECLSKDEEKIKIIQQCNNSVEEKVEYIENYMENIETRTEAIEQMDRALGFCYLLKDIIDAAEDTKYYDEVETINPNEYIYAGIEVPYNVTVDDIKE